jgi:hypothetical protein
LHYIQQVEPAFRPAALAFGTAFHEAIGEYLRASRPEQVVPVEQLHKVFCRSFQAHLKGGGVPVVFDEEETAAQHVELAKKMLRAFVEQIEPPQQVRGIEVPFRLDIDDPETGEVLPALVGAIDVVVETECGTEAWELKTAARRWANDPLEYDLQPTVVQMGARSLGFHDAKPVLIITTKTKTPTVQRAAVHRGPEDEHDVLSTAASVTRAIAAGVDHPIRGWPCRSCPYAHACR